MALPSQSREQMKALLKLPDELFDWVDAEKAKQSAVEGDLEVRELVFSLATRLTDVPYMNANMKWILEEIANPKWSVYHRSVLASLVVLFKIMRLRPPVSRSLSYSLQRESIEEVAAFVAKYVVPFSPVSILLKMPTISSNKNVIHNVISMNCSIIVAYVGIAQNLADGYVNSDKRKLIEPFVNECIGLYRYYREPLSKFKSAHLKSFDETFGLFEGDFEVGADIEDFIVFIQRVNIDPRADVESEAEIFIKAAQILEKQELLVTDDEESVLTMKTMCVELLKFFSKLWRALVKPKDLSTPAALALRAKIFSNIDSLIGSFRYLGSGQELKTELLISDTIYMKELWESEANQCVVCALSGSSTCGKCQIMKYCSRGCQVKHWKTHKLQCGMAGSLNELIGKFRKFPPWPEADFKDGDIVIFGEK